MLMVKAKSELGYRWELQGTPAGKGGVFVRVWA